MSGPTRPSKRWGSRWLRTVEESGHIGADAMERGRSYGGYDWQLDVDIEPGVASTLARSGPRLTYRAAVRTPVIGDKAWTAIVESIAASTDRTAALLEGDLDEALISDAEALGTPLFPTPESLTLSCECRSSDRPCKHAAAVLHLLADAIDDDPFDLLHLRGRDRIWLTEAVTAARNREDAAPANQPMTGEPMTGEPMTGHPSDRSSNAGATGSQTRTADGGEGENSEEDANRTTLDLGRAPQPVPAPLPLPNQPKFMPPFPSDPPETALFTADGLRILGSDAAARAHALLDGPSTADSELDLDPTSDMARRAALLKETDLWRGLVERSGLSSQELSARATAWERAGESGLEAHVAPVETVKAHVSGQQWRRNRAQQWFAFERRSGRYELISGPHEARPLDELRGD